MSKYSARHCAGFAATGGSEGGARQFGRLALLLALFAPYSDGWVSLGEARLAALAAAMSLWYASSSCVVVVSGVWWVLVCRLSGRWCAGLGLVVGAVAGESSSVTVVSHRAVAMAACMTCRASTVSIARLLSSAAFPCGSGVSSSVAMSCMSSCSRCGWSWRHLHFKPRHM